MNHVWHCILQQIVFSKDGHADVHVPMFFVSKIYHLGYLLVMRGIPLLGS